jgi:hypothetical protein
MDAATWNNLRIHTWGLGAANAVNVSIRAIVNGSLTAASTGSLNIATVEATGNVVYWATTGNVDSWIAQPDSSYLAGFSIGTPGYTQVLEPSQVATEVRAGNGTTSFSQWGTQIPVQCIGCHASTPDGESVAFVAQFADPIVVSNIELDAGTALGASPSWLSPAALNALQPWPAGQSWGGDVEAASFGTGTPTFSKTFWSDTAKLMVTSRGNDLADWATEATNSPAQLYWVDLLSTTSPTGLITRTDPRSAAVPSWSHDGTTILYTSTNVKNSERLGFNGNNTGTESNAAHPPAVPAGGVIADLYTVAFDGNTRTSGANNPVPGASSATESEYYGSFSADDKLIAYNAVPSDVPAASGSQAQVAGELYSQPAAEVFVIPAGGGTGTRLAANDPASCVGVSSPGINNSWPKWSPEVLQDPKTPGRYYYWLAFSSERDPSGNAQLYLAPVTIESDGTMVTYPAVYFWNQDASTSNRTPAWDNFQIPATYIPSIH